MNSLGHKVHVAAIASADSELNLVRYDPSATGTRDCEKHGLVVDWLTGVRCILMNGRGVDGQAIGVRLGSNCVNGLCQGNTCNQEAKSSMSVPSLNAYRQPSWKK